MFTGDGNASKEFHALSTAGIAIGVMPDIEFKENVLPLGSTSKLYVFSDGVYEITQQDGKEMSLDDYTKVMQESFNNLEVLQTEKVLEKITSLKREKGPFDDDFSIVELILNA